MNLNITRILTHTFLFATLALPAFAHADSDTAAITALFTNWRDAVERGDKEAYLAGLHEDISLRPPGVAGLDGRDNYRAFLGPVFETAEYKIAVDSAPSVVLMGDSAIVEYDYTITLSVKAGSEDALPEGALTASSTTSHYIDVVQKDASGAWKVRLHSWSVTQ
jgi:ketosteroid isomerase-like protein